MATEGERRPNAANVRRDGPNWLKRAKFVLLLVVVVLVLIVFFQNLRNTTFTMLFWHPEIPAAVLLLAAFVAGAGVGGIALHLLRRPRG